MKQWFQRQRVEWEDWVRYSPWIRNCLGRMTLFRAKRICEGNDQQIVRKIVRLATAARWSSRESVVNASLAEAQRLSQKLHVNNVDWTEFQPDVNIPRMVRATLLKPWVSAREKGVLYIAFESEWARLIHYRVGDAVAEKYDVVLAPSSSPHNVANYLFPLAFPGNIFTQISNPSDTRVLPKISSRFVVLPHYASSWVLPETFVPRPRTDRDIDLIMVANFARVKRHFALFRAIGSMPKHLRVLLIGQAGEGQTSENLLQLARAYGVEGRFTLITDASHDEVASFFARARASVILSRREGSCVVVTESMFADTPVALLEGSVIGSIAFINDQTGRLLPGRRLAEELTQFIEESDRYRARAWAEENISCHASSRLLNALLKQHSLDRGDSWTVDLAPLRWCPDPEVIHPEDIQRLQEATKEFSTQYGIFLGRSAGRDPDPHLTLEVCCSQPGSCIRTGQPAGIR